MRLFLFVLFLVFVFTGCDDSSNNKQNFSADSDLNELSDDNEPDADKDVVEEDDSTVSADEDLFSDEDAFTDIEPETDVEPDADNVSDSDDVNDDSDVCDNGSQRAFTCGLNDNGTLIQICNNGVWEDSGPCSDPDVCENGLTSSEQCGFNNTGVKIKNCVNGQWVYEECWTAHGMLVWSDVSPNTLTWDNALLYCSNKGARVPTISELRSIIINCSYTESSGSCTVVDSCLSNCINSECSGCIEETDGRYSYFGDTNYLWSASEYNDSYVWRIEFKKAAVSYASKANLYNAVRCVK